MVKRAGIAALAVAALVALVVIFAGIQGGGHVKQAAPESPAESSAQVRAAVQNEQAKRSPAPAPAPRQPKATPEPGSAQTGVPLTQRDPEQVRTQVHDYLESVDRSRLPNSAEIRKNLQPYENELRGMIQRKADVTGTVLGPFCDNLNAVVYSLYSWMLSMGIPNGPSVGLPDFPNPCPANKNLAPMPFD
ncbi:hypothetical protein [Sciscionella sediminilitoris]|uniref:hypothetical protein n=1 Tax=Sciscionella sediminilitoris TaxID=1445613 RepID=UPI0012E1D4F4|nr:hypothetical protein [Sciscionella sp. SE31]